MTVKTNYVIAIAMLGDCLKKCCFNFSTKLMGTKTKANRMLYVRFLVCFNF